EWPKGAVCKIAGVAYGGSNPPPPTSGNAPPANRRKPAWSQVGHQPGKEGGDPHFMNPLRRYAEWLERCPPWQRGLQSGVLLGAWATFLFGRGQSWLSIGLGTGSGFVFGVWAWLYTRRRRGR